MITDVFFSHFFASLFLCLGSCFSKIFYFDNSVRLIEHSKELFFVICKRKFHSPCFIFKFYYAALRSKKIIQPEESRKKVRSFYALFLHNVASLEEV